MALATATIRSLGSGEERNADSGARVERREPVLVVSRVGGDFEAAARRELAPTAEVSRIAARVGFEPHAGIDGGLEPRAGRSGRGGEERDTAGFGAFFAGTFSAAISGGAFATASDGERCEEGQDSHALFYGRPAWNPP